MFLKMEDISFGYHKKEKKILDHFHLSVEKGELVGLLGQSGCGKSTILKLIAGLEKVQDGKIYLDDTVLSTPEQTIPPEKRKIGMIFQDYGLFPHLSVYKNITFGLFYLSKEEQKTRANEMLSLIQMESLKARYPYELSGGQQQRVALARALAPKPKLLLMDEPFSSLDTELKKEIRREMAAILKQEEMTSILVSHDSDDINDICTRQISWS